jgi:hypothetical protein
MRNTLTHVSGTRKSIELRRKNILRSQSAETLAEPQVIVIPHRAARLTRAALKQLAAIVDSQTIQIRLIDVCVLPYQIDLGKSNGIQKRRQRGLMRLVQNSPLSISTEVFCARKWEHGFRRALKPASVVLIPIKRSNWKTRDKRMAARLRRLGHQVLWAQTE